MFVPLFIFVTIVLVLTLIPVVLVPQRHRLNLASKCSRIYIFFCLIYGVLHDGVRGRGC